MADEDINSESTEMKLAMKEISRAEKRGLGYHAQIGAAMTALSRKGFSHQYSQQVAETAWDMLFD